MFEKGLSALVGTHCEHDSVVCFIKRRIQKWRLYEIVMFDARGVAEAGILTMSVLLLGDGSRWADLVVNRYGYCCGILVRAPSPHWTKKRPVEQASLKQRPSA